MCGVCGYFPLNPHRRTSPLDGRIDAMTDVMTHRGPDDRGVHRAPAAAIGARRLSVVDLDGGHQPFSNEDGTVGAAQNGEIYNHAELARGLRDRGHVLRSRCDTEVIPHLYEEFGEDFPRHLWGMFGIAVWDERRRRGLLVRDRLGVKPLYWAEAGGQIVFGSELKAVLASGIVPLDLDHEAIDAYLTLGYLPGPRTPLAAVRKLEPGHVLSVADGRVEVSPYWEYPAPAPRDGSPAEHRDALLAMLDDAVRLRLMADVPVGAMLSGGLDSSLITALMVRHSATPVKTFAVGFREAGDANELGHARRVAQFLGTDHHELELSMADTEVDLARLVWHMDEPLADLSAIGFMALCELAREHVTVALSGQGADELLGGYDKHRAAALVGAVRRGPVPAGLAAAVAGRGPDAARRLSAAMRTSDPAARLLAFSALMGPAERDRLVRGPLAAVAPGSALRMVRRHSAGLGDDPLAAQLALDAQLALPDGMLHYFDRGSMARSLEVRVPFLDHRLVELAATIPSGLKVHGLREGKYVLREAARGLVPDWVLERRKVGFFHATVDGWLSRQADGVAADYLLDPGARVRELLDPERIRGLVHAPGRHGRVLLAALMLEIWLAEYLPRAAASRAVPAAVAA